MAESIIMPSLGMFTAEGTLGAWLKPPGADVKAGEPVVEITTEKVTQEIVAPASGILHPMVEVGAVLPIQALIGYILAEGEAAPAVSAGAPPPTSPSPPRPPSRAESLPRGDALAREVRATPIARRLAAAAGLDLGLVAGSGPGGRIVESDIQAAIAQRDSAQAASALPQRAVRERIPLIGIRRIIAERLRNSLSTAAPVTLTREVDAEVFVTARAALSERLGARLTYDALFVKLFGLALRAHIGLNAVIEDDAILVLDEIHVGFAVAISQGLVVPVVRNADVRPLGEVAEIVRELAQRAEANALHPDEVSGGTATISNLGAYGVDAFSPIINPPQSVILGCGRLLRRPVVHAEQVTVRHVCTLSLTFDHRVTDGVPAARLLDEMARLMSDEVQLDGLV
jgi:pyruvate dehydrogenase E2 component (dihydrolipoamide acetyltransferase)